ncbi:RNA polymerase sigma-70 factor [Mucilaginibacter rubeus]|uniref:RNA polymerase sigma-70 factor n=1 Tax=Mucilaginibacter rubeus TaxID=2027860 RepID=A0AAE6MGU0_9SPHI|nr:MULTISPECIES: RNA polymerase sigma-70 factor [Mucilaginibacter]QEM02584.1 RNA polymerase sigma-70 factor [Mucilaginibacter rubeus]QEM15204.1 RNA polymerase sigma-70 factor [Mucilaginibacter gossypii]QTE42072.1 RNA polymerase sigma-70 factor [Mucilaginibacter rubeus]QTE48673.1 RNA polymerase sigma-70 factor [Mucilaginibacter rubeus]QTE60059.1 RNA polymerase sigma-70 factor [Mucilaginibacter rubeus]
MEHYSKLTDEKLILLLKENDHKAYAQIYDRYKFILHAHAINKLRDREEARDIIQEVFTYLWAKREQIVFTGNLSGYLYGAVRNAILNKMSRKRVHEKYHDSMKAFALPEQIVTDHRVRENLLRENIEREIAMLPPKMKAVFIMSRKEYLSHREIAWKLEISEQTVNKQITNALKILKVKLGIVIYLLVFLHL